MVYSQPHLRAMSLLQRRVHGEEEFRGGQHPLLPNMSTRIHVISLILIVIYCICDRFNCLAKNRYIPRHYYRKVNTFMSYSLHGELEKKRGGFVWQNCLELIDLCLIHFL